MVREQRYKLDTRTGRLMHFGGKWAFALGLMIGPMAAATAYYDKLNAAAVCPPSAERVCPPSQNETSPLDLAEVVALASGAASIAGLVSWAGARRVDASLSTRRDLNKMDLRLAQLIPQWEKELFSPEGGVPTNDDGGTEEY